MKHLIPIGFAFTGAYLIGLPLYSQITAINVIKRLVIPNSGGTYDSFPVTPYFHLFLPWITGIILIYFSVRLAIKSYNE